MGLFDSLKNKYNEKASEIHICYRCKKEYKGFLQGHKLTDNEFICFDCFPEETPLMKQKKVKNPDFNLYQLDAKGIDRYYEQRQKFVARQEKFSPTEMYYKDNILVDRENMLFKLSEYDEVFPIQQIKGLAYRITNTNNDNKFEISAFIMVENWIYKFLPIHFKHKTSSHFFRKHSEEELISYLLDFHEKVCPDALIDNKYWVKK